MSWETIRVRGERIAILAKFMETIAPDEAEFLVEKMLHANIISTTAASLLLEHIEEAQV